MTDAAPDVFEEHPLPSGARVTKLVLLHRHGERTTVANRFPEHALDVDTCSLRAELRAPVALASADQATHVLVREQNIAPDADASHFDPTRALGGACARGELTDAGVRTTERLGRALRAHYGPLVDEPLYQSTDVPRALASARGVLAGIAAGGGGGVRGAAPVFFRKHFAEIIYPNWGACARLKELSAQCRRDPALVEAQDAFKWRLPTLFGLDESALEETGVPEEYSSDGSAAKRGNVLGSRSRSTHAFFDEACVRQGHNAEQLPGATKEHIADAAALSVREWFGPYTNPATHTEACRLGIGPLLREFNGQLMHGKFSAAFFSGHDTSVAPTLACLGAFNPPHWPKYAANVALEKLEMDGSEFVQLRYNGKPMTMTPCADDAPPGLPTFCPLQRYLEFTSKLIPTASELAHECRKQEK